LGASVSTWGHRSAYDRLDPLNRRCRSPCGSTPTPAWRSGLTLAQVQAYLDAAALLCEEAVHVCENPSVVEEAAARLGAACPPLVCVEGWPSVATTRLLSSLRAGGAELRYHGNFDWQGLQIAADVLGLGAHPWRFGAADYRAALSADHPPLPTLGAALPMLAAGWDPDLVAAMTAASLAVEEEHVLDVLVLDLAGAAGTPAPSA
jgi:uncharacterized protein (TIGR02679 family)